MEGAIAMKSKIQREANEAMAGGLVRVGRQAARRHKAVTDRSGPELRFASAHIRAHDKIGLTFSTVVVLARNSAQWRPLNHIRHLCQG